MILSAPPPGFENRGGGSPYCPHGAIRAFFALSRCRSIRAFVALFRLRLNTGFFRPISLPLDTGSYHHAGTGMMPFCCRRRFAAAAAILPPDRSKKKALKNSRAFAKLKASLLGAVFFDFDDLRGFVFSAAHACMMGKFGFAAFGANRALRRREAIVDGTAHFRARVADAFLRYCHFKTPMEC